MKRILFLGASMFALMTLLWSNASAQDNKSNSKDDDEMYRNDFPDNPGLWSALVRDDKVYIQFGGHHWSSGATFSLAELGPLPTDKQGSLTVKRDAGTVTFNGTFDGKRGHGTYSFEEDPTFKSYLAQEGFTSISETLMIHLYFTDINKAYFAFMKENGYTGITMNELKHLAEENMNQHVMTGYLELFRKDNYGKVSLDKVVELREHGVDPEFVADMKKIGQRDITLDEAIELRDHGVSVQFVHELTDMGYANISLEKAVELVDHGVSADFVKGFRDLGFKDITLDQAVKLVDHGVSVGFVKEFKGLGFSDLTLRKAVELVDHGVTVEFVKRMQEKGLKNMSLDEYIRLRDGGM